MASTFSAKVAADLIQYARSRGADGDALEAMLHLPPGRLGMENVRIPCAAMAALWKRAMEAVGDPDLAFHMTLERRFHADRTTQGLQAALRGSTPPVRHEPPARRAVTGVVTTGGRRAPC